MAWHDLSADQANELRAARFTYDFVGVTRGDVPVPTGVRTLERSRTLVRDDLDALGAELFTWSVPERAGLDVVADGPVRGGAVVVLGTRFGALRLRARCRVVYVIDEPDRRGFAYGTLPGHPESGEEAFLLTRAADGQVTFTVSAVARPASLVARVGGPITHRVQDRITSRYLTALDR